MPENKSRKDLAEKAEKNEQFKNHNPNTGHNSKKVGLGPNTNR